MKNYHITNVKLLFILLVTFSPLFLLSQPRLLELFPKRVYVQNVIPAIYNVENPGGNAEYMNAAMHLELSIEKLNPAINISNYSDRVKLYFKKGADPVQIKISSWTPEKLTTWYMSNKWLTNNDPVEVFFEVDGVRSNTINLIVVYPEQVPPTITSLSKSRITVTKDNLRIRIVGKNLGQEVETNVKINEMFLSMSDHDYMEGWVDVNVPESVRTTPGTYPINIISIYGKSNTLYLVVEKPVLTFANVPQAPTVNRAVSEREDPNKFEQKSNTPLSVVGSGIIVKMYGTIQSEKNRSQLENHCRAIPEVRKIENNIQVSTNQNITVSVKGYSVEKVTLEYVKLSIEKKLKSLGVSGVVSIE